MIKKVILILSLVTLSLSCSHKSYLGRHFNERLFERLYKNNGNVFYFGTTYYEITFIWSYVDDKVVIYKLENGKIISNKNVPAAKPNFLNKFIKKEMLELDSCMALDDDMFGFKLNDGSRNDFASNIDCFLTNKFNSNFLQGVKNDMIKYDIKW